MYIGPGKILVNGGRIDLTEDTIEGRPVVTLPEVKVDIAGIHRDVRAYIQKFDELAQLDNRDQFIQDLVDECAWAQTLHLEYLVKGARTKPYEWTTQILARGLATVMRRHRLKAAISEYENRNRGVIQRSLYLRLIQGLSKIAGFRIPKDVKGHALRAKRINHKAT
jgi:hypothetical protein